MCVLILSALHCCLPQVPLCFRCCYPRRCVYLLLPSASGRAVPRPADIQTGFVTWTQYIAVPASWHPDPGRIMQHVSVLLLLLVSPWHAESFLPSARPGRSLGGSAELERRARMMCGFSAGEKKKASAAAGAAAARGSPAGASGGRESTWSNPGGKDLVKVSDGVWAAERPFVWNSIDVGKSSASCIRLKVSRQSPRVSCTKKAPAPAGKYKSRRTAIPLRAYPRNP